MKRHIQVQKESLPLVLQQIRMGVSINLLESLPYVEAIDPADKSEWVDNKAEEPDATLPFGM